MAGVASGAVRLKDKAVRFGYRGCTATGGDNRVFLWEKIGFVTVNVFVAL